MPLALFVIKKCMIEHPFASIVIANYNGEKHLERCLKSVLKQNYKNFDLIIVDDGSTDNSQKIIRKYLQSDKRIKLISNKSNLGAAASRNNAIKISNSEILVFLDNDTAVEKNWLKELIIVLTSNSNIGATQSLILDMEKGDLIQMAGGKLIAQTAWLIPRLQWKSYRRFKNSLKNTQIIAISASLAVKSSVFKHIGFFDEKEAVTTEDIDLSWRVWIAGYKILLAPKSIVYHETKSVEARKYMNVNYQKVYFHLAKNSFRSILKNYEAINSFRYLFMSIFINITRACIVIPKVGFSAMNGTIAAILWNIFNIRDTLLERKKVQLIRHTTDHELLTAVFDGRSIWQIYLQYFR